MINRINKILKFIIFVIITSAFFVPCFSIAQSSGMSFTVTPPLFQFTLTPGESWASSVKIVNGNSYDIIVYATPVNFESVGEVGKGRFVPLSVEDTSTSPHSLAGWIDITKEPIFIPKGKSTRVPFFVDAPANAEPGGHYASILVGTRPMGGEGDSQMKVSSLISTLLFASVSGDVVEEGRIREFSTEKSLYETPKANFTLRFENTGNVHVLPRGNIVIYNMWGKERGRIDVNKDINFGNVFPGKIRNFAFTWSGESNFYDIGRYKAISTLAYGAGAQKSDFNILYFWVIPIKPMLWVVGTFLIFILFIVLMLRRYVKHALKMQTKMLLGDGVGRAQIQQRIIEQNKQRPHATMASVQKPQPQKIVTPMQVLKQPIIQGSVDLRRAGVVGTNGTGEDSLSIIELFAKYKTFAFFSIGFVACLIVAIFFLKQVMVDEREFDIEVQDGVVGTINTIEKKIET